MSNPRMICPLTTAVVGQSQCIGCIWRDSLCAEHKEVAISPRNTKKPKKQKEEMFGEEHDRLSN